MELEDLTPSVSRDISTTWLQLGKQEKRALWAASTSSLPLQGRADVANSKAQPEERDRGSVCCVLLSVC